ncbi:MAG: beta-ketoacyl synthase N-terminal-like domain-containing protein [Candidatus Poseidoniaceae archaeon]|nr:beta-ketoacyl synthase N-terminal-like domain-containing protein [Candidatus Poseidoniaceae archaeon]
MSNKEPNVSELEGIAQGPFEPIAVVGMGCIMPDAEDIGQFWNNVLNARVSIKEIPEGRWKVDDFWAPGSPGDVEDAKTYAKIGAFIEGYEFDWRRWKVPPGTLGQIDICQQWAVTASAAALEHAGYLGEENRFKLPNASTGVVIANALGGEFRNLSNHRVWVDQFTRQAVEIGGMPEEGRELLKEAISEGKPEIDEDTMPGELANVMAGRVANLLDLQGPNHSTDAACASSMSAVLDSCRMLQSRQVDLMLAGASDRTMDPATYAKFSAIGALSPTHSTPFDARADGFVMGEGAGVLVLKRLDDAIEDGNDIYAVIRGIGASSDGRGKGITAPSQRGQMQALARAYSQAGFSPATVGLVEAHGTSTKVGDAMELGTLRKLWHESPAGEEIAVGSVKSQIGHLKAAAGMAGMLKTISAVSKGIIPPSAGFEVPNPTVDWSSIPFYVPTYAKEWDRLGTQPRRAAVSAFGFGGTNWHIVIEEFDKKFHLGLAVEWRQRWATFLNGPQPVVDSTTSQTKQAPSLPSGIVSKARRPTQASSILDPTAEPSMTWEELKEIEGGVLLLESHDLPSLKEELKQVREELLSAGPTFDDDPSGRRLSKELAAMSEGFTCEGYRIAVIASSWAEFDKRTTLALKTIDGRDKWGFLKSQGVLITDEAPLPEQAKIAHMFPGQGSQYVGMTHDLSKRFSGVAAVWKRADETMVEILDGETLSSFVLRSGLNEQERSEAEEKLKQTEYTQPAMLTADLAINQILADHGRSPDMVAGHSLGEYAALMVSGILGMDGALRAAAARGTEMGAVEISDRGIMASVTADYKIIADVLETAEGYVIAANKNSPKMTVIAGDTPSVKAVMRRFEGLDIDCVILQTSHAFHSTIVEPAAEPLRRFLEGLEINLPEIPITSNVDGEFYPMSRDPERSAKQQVLDKLAPQMASAVEWTKQIETMYASGARLFIEVGPKRALTMFASQILDNKPHISIMTNHPKLGGIPSLFNSLAEMAIAGRPYRWPRSDSPLLTDAFRAGPLEVWEEDASQSAQPVISATASDPMPVKETTIPVEDESTTQIEETSSEELEIEWISTILSGVSGYPPSMCRGNVNLRTGLGLSEQIIESVFNSLEKQGRVDASFDTSTIKTAAQICVWVEGVPSSFQASSSTHNLQKQPTVESVSSADVVEKVFVEKDPFHARNNDPFVVTGISLGLPGEGKVFDDDNFEKLVRGETCLREVPDEYKQKILDKNIVRLIKGRDGQARMEAAEEFSDIPQLAGMSGEFDITEEFGVDAKIARSWDTTTQLATAAGLIALRDAGIPLTPEEKVGKGGLRLITNWQIPRAYRNRTGVIFACCFPGTAKTVEHCAKGGDDGEGHFDRSYLFQVLNMGHSQFAQYTGIRGPNTTINLACASTAAAFSVAEDWLATNRCDRVVIISADNVTGPDLWEWIGSGFAASGAASTSDNIEEAALPFDKRRNGLILGMGAAAFVIEKKSDAAERGVQAYAELLGAHIANSSFHGTRLDVEHVAGEVNHFVTQMENRWGLDRQKFAPSTFFYSHETYTPARGGSAQAEVRALRETFGDSTDSLVISNTKGFTGHPMGVGIEDASMIHALHTGRAPPIANHKEVDPELGDLNLSKGGDHDGMRFGLRFAAGFGSQIAITFWKACEVEGSRIDMNRLMQWNRELAGTEDLQLKVLNGKLVAYLDGDENLHGGVQGEEWDPEDGIGEIEPDITQEEEPEPAFEPESKLKEESESPPAQIASDLGDITASLERDSVADSVVEVVVEHTGYPADFIELDQDLEGELGIDTVKQAEIMGDIREMFELPIDETFSLAEHPSLNHFVEYIVRMKGGKIETAPVVEESVSDEIPWRWSDNVVDEVLAEFHLDDRDELIESAKEHDDGNRYLKREELQAAAEQLKNTKMTWRYSENVVAQVLAEHGLEDAEALVEASKVHDDGNRYLKREELVAGAEDLKGDDPPLVNQVALEEKSQEVTLQTSPRAGVRRWQVEVEEAEIERDLLLLSSGTVVVSDDGIGISEEVCNLIEEKGASALRISFELDRKELVKEEHAGRTVFRVDPSDESQIAEMCEQVDGVRGIIHLAPIQLSGSPWDVSASSRAGSLANHSLFGLLKYLDGQLNASESAFVASLSSLDGRHGNIGERFNSLACGASGIIKSYAHERPEIRCRAWDVHPEVATRTESIAPFLVDDILQHGGEVEIGIDKDLRRWKLVMFDEELVGERNPLQSDDVWLVSGGGSGVTSSSIIGISEASRNAGAMFILLGRTKLLEEPCQWLDWSEEQLAERKMELREELLASNAEGKVSMVEWNNAWQPYLRSRDIHSTIATIRRTGNKAIYRACDVTDVVTLTEIAEELGPVTGIIHGAGIEDSKLVAEKSWSTFDTVVGIKVDGWKALATAAESSGDSLRTAVCFTSVAGRLGNGGQSDYAAANSVLDAEMARLSASKRPIQAVATAWTGWKDVGMATRGSLEKIFEAAGIETLAVEEGVSLFVDEVLKGGKRRVMCCGSMGIMDKFDSFRAPPLKLPPMMSGLIADPARFPFVDRLLDLVEGERLVSECLLSTSIHPFLIDHSIEGIPYHPGVMALEMFAENALLLQPEYCLTGFEEVKFGLPIKLVKGPVNVRVVAEVERRKRDHLWVRCHLESDLVNSSGEVFGKPRIHHKGLVRLVKKSDDLTRHLATELHDCPELGIPVKGELSHHPSFIYLRFFHGPRFQSHGGIISGFSEGGTRGADGLALMRHQLPEVDQFAVETEGESVLLEALPMLIEAGFQNAGLVVMEVDGLMSLPVGIEWMTILAVPEMGEKLRLRSIRVRMEENGISVHDVVVVGDDDSPILALRGLRLKAMAPLADEMKFTLDG